MKETDWIRKQWRKTVVSLIIVATVSIGIAIYDIVRSIQETGSADWKLWAALAAIVPLAGFLLVFMYLIMRVVRSWVKHKERR